ncbi:protein phosphatase 2C domain-containing protein [Streptomyces sp. NPDC094034]|uniref:protein phosphatase 2C domain-containing protein n=1 Tax=Streptomyces sp. NPDC094034 TaxID=3155309 RepID=UPI003332B62B
MSQQGERSPDGDWWNRLYDDSTPDTGPARATGDTLDDRFDSAAQAVSDPSSGQVSDPVSDLVSEPASEALGVQAKSVTTPKPPRPRPQPPVAGAPWEPAVPYAPSDARPLPGATAESPPSSPPTQPSPSPRPPDPRRSTPLPPAPVASPAAPVTHVGDGPPAYDPEPTALPATHADRLDEIVADTVLDGARYGTYTLRAMSVRGDSARHRGEPRRDALLTVRFGAGADALVLVAVAGGARATEGSHRAAADVCRWIGGAVGRSHDSLSADIRAGRRDDLKSGLHRLTDRGFGKLRARAAELGLRPEQYTAGLRCLLLSADPDCRTRVFFGVGDGGLFRLRDGAWQDLEPPLARPGASTGPPVTGFGSPPAETPEGDRLTMDLEITKPPSAYDTFRSDGSRRDAFPYATSPYAEGPPPPPPEPFRFRASVARPGDTLLLCGPGLSEPLRAEPALARELANRWGPTTPPGLAEFLVDTGLRVKGHADDRTAVGVWEA